MSVRQVSRKGKRYGASHPIRDGGPGRHAENRERFGRELIADDDCLAG